MPRPVTIYACTCCGRNMADYDDVFRHEAVDHFRLSVDEYERYEQLSNEVSKTEGMLERARSHIMVPMGEIRANLEAQMERLLEFEASHDLEHEENPFLR